MATLLALAALAMGGALLLGWVVIDRPLPPLSELVSAEAMIVSKRLQPGEWTGGKFPPKPIDRYFVLVSFPLSQTQVQSNEIEIGRAEFDTIRPGDEVRAWYFPEMPNINTIGNPATIANKGSRYAQLFGWVLVIAGTWGAVVQGNKWHMGRGGQSVL